MRELPEPVRRVAVFLVASRAEARLEEFPSGTSTAVDAARALGCQPGQIVKSIVFDCDGAPLLVLVPGDRRADARRVAAAAPCSRARVAPASLVEQATGFAPGAVAPFPPPTGARVLIERTLLAHGVVWVGAGSPEHMAGLAPAELVRLSDARPVDALERSR